MTKPESEALQGALEAIHDEVVKLLRLEHGELVVEKLRLIQSIARHGADLRSPDESEWNPQPGELNSDEN